MSHDRPNPGSRGRQLVWLALLLASVGCTVLWMTRRSAARSSFDGENVLIVMVDALRADRLGAVSRGQAVTPFIDELSARSVVFEDATSTAAQTVPSVLSLFSSAYPSRHGNQYFHGTSSFRIPERKNLPLVPEELPLMAEHFRERGYRTGAVVTNPWLQEKWGFARGFERYEFQSRARGPTVNTTGLEMVDGWGRERPFFLYLHYMDVHFPRRPLPPFKDIFTEGMPGEHQYVNGAFPDLTDADRDYSLAAYDACVRSMDELLKDLMGELAQRGLDRSTLVVLVGDHGDEFGEHGGLGHGRTLYQEMLDVPLVLAHPALESRARRIREPVSLVDVFPTLVELTGGRMPAGTMGRSLAPLVLQGVWSAPAESTRQIAELGWLKSIRDGDRKLIWYVDDQRCEAFDLSEDPGEARDLAAHQPWVDELRAQLEAFLDGTRTLGEAAAPAEQGPGHEELMQSLEALGYAR